MRIVEPEIIRWKVLLQQIIKLHFCFYIIIHLSHDSINPDYKYKFLSYQALLAIISSLNKIYIL